MIYNDIFSNPLPTAFETPPRQPCEPVADPARGDPLALGRNQTLTIIMIICFLLLLLLVVVVVVVIVV